MSIMGVDDCEQQIPCGKRDRLRAEIESLRTERDNWKGAADDAVRQWEMTVVDLRSELAEAQGLADYWREQAQPVPVLKFELAQAHVELQQEIDASAAICHEVALVYDHITRGRISKANTLASEVIAVADDLVQQDIDEETREAHAETAVVVDMLCATCLSIVHSGYSPAAAKALLDRVERYDRALVRNGYHVEPCARAKPWSGTNIPPCSCGLDDLLEEEQK